MENKLDGLSKMWQKVTERFVEANFLQSPAWGKAEGELHKIVMISERPEAWCLGIVKNARRGRYLEIPGGPLVDWQDRSAVEEIFQSIRAVAAQERCAFVRLRPQLRHSEQNLTLLAELGCQKAPMHLHAEHTVIVDLTQSEEELLANLRRQTRYDVRRGEKLGIKVEFGNSTELFQEFHTVQAQTAERQGFVPPSLKMLLAERQAFGEQARIYVAKSEAGEPIAYGLIIWSGKEAEYFEAASTELHLKLPGSVNLLWHAMRDLKALGLERFNLWGIAPTDPKTGKTVSGHRYAGVTTFKTGFGGEVVEFVSAQDIVLQPARYLLNVVVERLRKKYRHL